MPTDTVQVKRETVDLIRQEFQGIDTCMERHILEEVTAALAAPVADSDKCNHCFVDHPSKWMDESGRILDYCLVCKDIRRSPLRLVQPLAAPDRVAELDAALKELRERVELVRAYLKKAILDGDVNCSPQPATQMRNDDD